MKKLLIVVAAALLVASAANANPKKFDPFLYWTELDSSYQGMGWINRDFIVGCHETSGDGEDKLTECTTSRIVEVRQNPHGRVIAGLSKGMPIIISERRGEWTKVDTYCAESINPGGVVGAEDWNHPDAYLFYCPEKTK